MSSPSKLVFKMRGDDLKNINYLAHVKESYGFINNLGLLETGIAST